MLLALLLGVLAFLWMLDAFFTVQVLEKKGEGKEANDLMRGLYGRSALLFVATKIAIMIFVFFAIFLISNDYLITTESIMFIFIYIYAKVDWHNYKIWRNRNSGAKNAKPAHSKRI